MSNLQDRASEIKKSRDGDVLERKIGEGSFVGFERQYSSPEEFVIWVKHLYAYHHIKSFARK